jgi:hypothetical protein
MAKVIATNFGEFSASATDFFENGPISGTFSSPNYANFFANGSGQAFTTTNNGGTMRRTKTVPAAAEYFVHIRHRLGTAGQQQGILCFDETGVNHIEILQNADGTISARRNGTVLQTGATVFSTLLGRILSVQVRVVIADAGGVVQVRINGSSTNEIDFSGDTRNGGAGVVNQIGVLSIPNDQQSQYTDFVVHDTGGSFANSWTGACRVVLGAFTIAGASGQQFTPSASTNQSNIDDVVPGSHDGDATYNEDSTPGHKDFFQVAASVFTGMSPASISYVVVKYWARAADGGSHTMRSDAKAGGTTVNGATVTLGSSYQLFEDAYYQDPSTSAAWASFAAIAGAEFGPELVS